MQREQLNSPFPATQWTVVLRVRAAGNEKSAGSALSRLCTDYWYPLYAYARKVGRSVPDAEDLTQSFFAYALARNLFASAEPQLGRLRTFLLTAFERYMADARQRDERLKRGGGREPIPIDGGEARYAIEPADFATPARLFERAWALSVIEAAMNELAAEETREGRAATFAVLESFLLTDGRGDGSYVAAGEKLGLSRDAARQSATRLRRRFREILRRRIADTLRNPTNSEIDAELGALRAALRG